MKGPLDHRTGRELAGRKIDTPQAGQRSNTGRWTAICGPDAGSKVTGLFAGALRNFFAVAHFAAHE
jgi:hypothetical protein